MVRQKIKPNNLVNSIPRESRTFLTRPTGQSGFEILLIPWQPFISIREQKIHEGFVFFVRFISALSVWIVPGSDAVPDCSWSLFIRSAICLYSVVDLLFKTTPSFVFFSNFQFVTTLAWRNKTAKNRAFVLEFQINIIFSPTGKFSDKAAVSN